jgi:hypothetical protein
MQRKSSCTGKATCCECWVQQDTAASTLSECPTQSWYTCMPASLQNPHQHSSCPIRFKLQSIEIAPMPARPRFAVQTPECSMHMPGALQGICCRSRSAVSTHKEHLQLSTHGVSDTAPKYTCTASTGAARLAARQVHCDDTTPNVRPCTASAIPVFELLHAKPAIRARLMSHARLLPSWC